MLDTEKTWTQIEQNHSKWHFSGIHDLEDDNYIERPSQIIPIFWSNSKQRLLLLDTIPSNSITSLHERVFQLALHFRGSSSAVCSNWDQWLQIVRAQVGETLGDNEDSFDTLSITNYNNPYKNAYGKTYTSRNELESLASEMEKQMLLETWKQVGIKITTKINQMDISISSEICNAIELRWTSWSSNLQNDLKQLSLLLNRIVAPAAEGEDILGHLRVGPKTYNLITEALFMLLIISIALDPNNKDFIKFNDGLNIGVIGIKYWSGPAGKRRRVREIDDIESTDDLIGKEASQILVLSSSRRVENEIYKDTLGQTKINDYSLAASKRPKLLITNNDVLKKLILEGKIEPLKNYLQEKIVLNQQAFNSAINQL